MAYEFDEIGGGSGGSKKKKKLTKKQKTILIAVAGVAAIALFVNYQKSKQATMYDGSQAIGYAGYPDVGGGGGGGGDDYTYSDELSSIQDEYNNSLEEIQNEYNNSLSDIQDDYNSSLGELNDKIISMDEAMKEQSLKMEREQDLAQMRANSELYNNITDRETKDRLHQENLAIASKYGWEYDGRTGQYFEGDTSLYMSSMQKAELMEGKKPATNTGSGIWTNNSTYNQQLLNGLNSSKGYSDGVDYLKQIDNAKASGASQSVIDNLTQQRQNKINAEYGGKDPGRYTGSSSSGSSSKSSSSGSSSKSSSSTSSSSSDKKTVISGIKNMMNGKTVSTAR